jgi:hypothetical protein
VRAEAEGRADVEPVDGGVGGLLGVKHAAVSFRLGPVFLREAGVDHPRAAFGDEQARRAANHTDAGARVRGRLQQRLDRSRQLGPVILQNADGEHDRFRALCHLAEKRGVMHRPGQHLEVLPWRDLAGVAGDADHLVASVEQFTGDGAAGVASDTEDDDLGHDAPFAWQLIRVL